MQSASRPYRPEMHKDRFLYYFFCLCKSLKERFSCRAVILFPGGPGNHSVNHVSDSFPELRTQRYIDFQIHANFFEENFKKKCVFYSFNIKTGKEEYYTLIIL